MCKQCIDVQAGYDTDYGGDPVAEQATEQPSDMQIVSANVVTPGQLEDILSKSGDDAEVLLYQEGAIKLEGKYYTFGSSDQAKAALTKFVEDHLDRVTEPEMTVADPAGVYGPAQTDDMHDTATVENTTVLIQDLEDQLADTKERLVRVTEQKEEYFRGTRILARAFESSKRINAAQEARAKTFAAFALSALKDIAANLEVSKARTNYYQQKSDKLQATIDYMKRPFYERWAISLRGRVS
jgi:hypothetical protein